MAPTDVPTMRSGRTSWSIRARSIPTCTAPRLAPPERTTAVGIDATVDGDGIWHAVAMLHDAPAPDLDVLRSIEQRVLWLAVRMVDHANRREGGEVKVGGHQASSASMVSIMTALWFAHIGGEDKVAVKPHASPVYHAIKYLTGELDRRTSPPCANAAGCRPTRRAPRIPTSPTSPPGRSVSVRWRRCSAR